MEFEICTYSCYIGTVPPKTGATNFKIACIYTSNADSYSLMLDEPTSWISNIHKGTEYGTQNDILADIAPNDTGSKRTSHADLIANYTNGDQKRIAVIIDINFDQSG